MTKSLDVKDYGEYKVQVRKTPEERAQLLDALCEWMTQGRTISEFCRQNNVGRGALDKWVINSPNETKEKLARARELGCDAIADETLAIADQAPERDKDGKVDAGDIAHRKLKIWTRQQLISKWAPRTYGDKQQVDHTVNVSIFDKLAQEQKMVTVSD
jgi:hypothetical protein